ncbi:MAG: hypothetical protein H6Q35_2493 [Proteobacteria bacterium]|nr:hypothetical protein [Pseudomonadota bacterium]MBS1229270.1 hypothetical protein [Pseudomonadota bacterium]
MSKIPEKTDEDGDTRWFDALSGRLAAADDQSPAADEGRTLRQALLSLDREEAASEQLDADWQRLRFRLRREGLVGQRRPLVYWALAASLCLAVGLAWFGANNPLEQPESQLLRGAQATTVVLRVADPGAAAERLITLCRDAGIAVRRRDSSDRGDGTVLLDLVVPAQLPAALADVFKDYGSAPPPAGKVTLVLMDSR